MTGYFLAGIFATACGFLFWQNARYVTYLRQLTARHDEELDRVRAENKLLLATALEARGAQLIDPTASPRLKQVAQQAARVSIEARLAKLAEDDATKAMDRDARVAREIDEAQNAASEMRQRLNVQEGH